MSAQFRQCGTAPGKVSARRSAPTGPNPIEKARSGVLGLLPTHWVQHVGSRFRGEPTLMSPQRSRSEKCPESPVTWPEPGSLSTGEALSRVSSALRAITGTRYRARGARHPLPLSHWPGPNHRTLKFCINEITCYINIPPLRRPGENSLTPGGKALKWTCSSKHQHSTSILFLQHHAHQVLRHTRQYIIFPLPILITPVVSPHHPT